MACSIDAGSVVGADVGPGDPTGGGVGDPPDPPQAASAAVATSNNAEAVARRPEARPGPALAGSSDRMVDEAFEGRGSAFMDASTHPPPDRFPGHSRYRRRTAAARLRQGCEMGLVILRRPEYPPPGLTCVTDVGQPSARIATSGPRQPPWPSKVVPPRSAPARNSCVRRLGTSVMDRTITCRHCGQPFVFTEGEQRFYAERGLSHEPQRCASCRALAKRSRSPANREYHPAICADCGKQTSVPFEPQPNRLVYCSSCFDQIRAAQGDRRTTGGSGGPSKPGAPSSP